MLLHCLTGALLHLLAHGCTQTDTIGSFRCHFDSHDGAAAGVGGQLHVHRRVEASVGHLHTPRFGVGRAHPWFPLAYLFSVLTVTGPSLRYGLLQTFQPLLRRLAARRLLSRAHLCRHAGIDLLAQLFDMLPALMQQLLQTLFSAETARSRTHPHPHSILADTAYAHYLLIHQRRYHLRK